MKNITKILTKCLIFTMLMSFTGTTVFAQEINNTLVNESVYVQSDTIPEKVNEITRSKFQLFLEGIREEPQNYEIQANQIDNLYLGQGFNVFTVEEDNIKPKQIYYFPVILNENFKFIFTIILNSDGSYSATLGRDFANALNNLQKNAINDPYIIINTSKGEMFAQNSKDSLSLNGEYLRLDQKNNVKLPINLSQNNKSDRLIKNISNKFETLPIDASDTITQNNLSVKNPLNTLSSSGNSLNVGIVAQGDLPICWAATVASITNYRNKYSLTAKTVCDNMNLPYQGVAPTVSADALNHYSVTSTYTATVPSQSTIMNNIDNGKPIYMSSDSTIGAHATTLYGYMISTQGFVIRLIDPAYACFKQGFSNGATFTYDFGSYVMTWNRTVMINSTPYPGYSINYGSTGSNVVKIQVRLNALRFNCGAADGSFGTMTKNAVIDFQKSRGISADGVVGPTTWLYLFNK